MHRTGNVQGPAAGLVRVLKTRLLAFVAGAAAAAALVGVSPRTSAQARSANPSAATVQ
jgi:hypothetical protein